MYMLVPVLFEGNSGNVNIGSGPGAIGSGTLFFYLGIRQLILLAMLLFSPVQGSLLVV